MPCVGTTVARACTVARPAWLNDRGGALTEFALVLPTAIMFTIGVLLLCLYLSSYIGATFASRAAVRYAIVHGSSSTTPCTSSSIQALVQPFVIGVPQNNITVSTSWSPDNNAGSTVSITILLSYPLAIPFTQQTTLTSSLAASGTIVE